MVDWQEIVRRVGRSRTDFTIITWDDRFVDAKVIRLKCNCCDAWAQRLIPYEALIRAYYPDQIIALTIEYLVRFMLNVDPGGTYADRRAIAGSREDSQQA